MGTKGQLVSARGWGVSPGESRAIRFELYPRHRYRSDMSRIVVAPDVCNGVPTVQGTRITVRTVLGFLSAGDTIDEVLEEYPTLSREDVLACLDYSARLMKHHFDPPDGDAP